MLSKRLRDHAIVHQTTSFSRISIFLDYSGFRNKIIFCLGSPVLISPPKKYDFVWLPPFSSAIIIFFFKLSGFVRGKRVPDLDLADQNTCDKKNIFLRWQFTVIPNAEITIGRN